MPLSSMVPLLEKARKGQYAVALFDVGDSLGLGAVLDAARDLQSPVILGIVGGFFRQTPAKPFISMARAWAEELPVPVSIELDHGRDFEQCMWAIQCGCTDVMIDASTLPFEENVAKTREVVRVAHAMDIGVEAEIGHVGRGSDYEDFAAVRANFTSPEEARAFVEATGVDALAVAIGSAHGVFRGEPRLDLERLAAIREVVGVPLVMHGGSGIPDDVFRQAVAAGISKVNIFTAMALSSVAKAQEMLAGGEMPHLLQLLSGIREAQREVVAHHIEVFGSAHKA